MKTPVLILGLLSLLGIVAAEDGASRGIENGSAVRVVLKNQGFLPFGDAPINYRTSKTLTDQITLLNRQLEQGRVQLEYEPQHGYLKSVLKLLGVPENSQTLVFSKTSLQFQHIGPKTPRALYFNDNVYVGQVQNAKSLELIAFDATQGAVFYVLGEQKEEKPRFERAQLDCVQCHIAAGTRRIPGVVVRSVLTSAAGNPKGGAPLFTMGHETPLEDRWGGWYVTGSALSQKHIGNYQGPNGTGGFGQNLPQLSGLIDTTRYLTPHSDIVAHLVLAHQTQMHNYITETNYRYRLGLHADQLQAAKDGVALKGPSENTRSQYEASAEATVRYLLFSGEVPLTAPVEGSSAFAAEFAALGPKDRQGRSLRDFDLKKRIFKFPCSYLIYSDAFDALPGPAREYILRRLFEVLTGRDQSEDFATLTPEVRRGILEILVDTKPGLPDEWARYLKSNPLSANIPPAVKPAQLKR